MYIVGIDLGTTNSVLAYWDTHADDSPAAIQVFEVPQLVAPGEIASLPALPSFLYLPTEHDTASGSLSLPWDEQPASVAGVMAREQGALTPGRQVSSAKSWLCDPAVDRRAAILPPDAEPSTPRISPVEASTSYLTHLRDAWNLSHSDAPLEEQEIILTVPASFDAEARELTVEAAQRAGLHNIILLEEPLAAFYSWLAVHQGAIADHLRDGDQVLICDVGGGTTDFSLVRARGAATEIQLERTAIGEHLLLGGDNLDFALSRLIEEKLGRPRLSTRQRHALRRSCCAAKEQLLIDSSRDHLPVTVLGTGRAVVGGALTTDLKRSEILDILTMGFLPLTANHEMPRQTGRRAALRELGLQYASDPAITRHLAEFLVHAAHGARYHDAANAHPASGMQRPDAILFNGGFFSSAIARDRVVEAVSGWFRGDTEWQPRVLQNRVIDAAVATGAVYYGRVRRGSGFKVRAGSPRSYYVALRSEDQLQAVCVLPSGIEEGTSLSLDRDFAVLANRPAAFTLYSSTTRSDRHGAVTTLSGDDIHRHAPLVTLLRYGKKLRTLELAVRLRASFTEVGTLELWCEAVDAPHRWRLQFELRADLGERPAHAPAAAQSAHQEQAASGQQLAAAVKTIRAAFAEAAFADKRQDPAEPVPPDALVARLEGELSVRRDSWPLHTLRALWDALQESADGRRQSARHETRWLNLSGFCLRPGFGAPRDEQRIAFARNLWRAGPAFTQDLQVQVEWLILWRRIAGGLNASHQHEVQRWCDDVLGLRAKKKARPNRQVEQETWRLLASLEQLPASTRAGLGKQLVARIKKEPDAQAWLWSLGRLGSRIPLYGPLGSVVSPEIVEEWLSVLLHQREFTSDAAFAVVLLATPTGDPQRDVTDKLRREAISRLNELPLEPGWVQSLKRYSPPSRADVGRMFGDSLPKGLNFLSSPACILPLAGLLAESSGPEERVS